MAPVIDEVDADGVTTVGGSGERVGVGGAEGLEVMSECKSW
jgi:hypothetical protein